MNHRCLQSSALIICAALAGIAQADGLGQLFTSASERARIDTLRAGTQPQQETAAASAPAAHIVVNGTLQGSDGKRLVWLNGSAVNPSDSSDMALLGDGRVELSWRDGKRKVKPGQGLDQASGEIFEHQTPAPVAAAKEPEATAKPDGAATIPEATVTATVDSTSAVPGPETKPK